MPVDRRDPHTALQSGWFQSSPSEAGRGSKPAAEAWACRDKLGGFVLYKYQSQWHNNTHSTISWLNTKLQPHLSEDWAAMSFVRIYYAKSIGKWQWKNFISTHNARIGPNCWKRGMRTAATGRRTGRRRVQGCASPSSVFRLNTQWFPPLLQHCSEETFIEQGAYLIFPNSEKLKTNACPLSCMPDRESGGQETQICSAWWVQPGRHCLHINYRKTLLAAPPMLTVSDCHCVPN